ncbi:hypothetical protein [Methylobacterium sp. WL18]|uniref:hypothetical protein n=1 Tax=Methylobacterium sp. WL18 TaxID=2603897 RepID=UPI0011CB6C00|nr:hypothetical protein [Methylobacterium sp. WL18]
MGVAVNNREETARPVKIDSTGYEFSRQGFQVDPQVVVGTLVENLQGGNGSLMVNSARIVPNLDGHGAVSVTRNEIDPDEFRSALRRK